MNRDLSSKTKFVACEVFRDELEHLGIRFGDCTFLERGLHRYPKDLNKKLSQNIRRIEEEHSPDQIILIYGYCGGGLENISTKKANLVFARVQDCIPLLLGTEPNRMGPEGKGIYFLSRGWLKYGKNPYTDYLELRKRYGHEEAFRSCKKVLKMCDHVLFIQTIPNGFSNFRDRSKKFAEFFGMKHLEMQGNFSLLKALLQAQSHEKIICLKPKCKISKKDFKEPSNA